MGGGGGIKGLLPSSPLSKSCRGTLDLSRGVSPYLLQMLMRAPLVTRSWREISGERSQEVSPVPLPQSTTYPFCGFARTSPSHLSHLVLAPKAGIMQGGVSMFIHCVDVRLELDQLGGRGRKENQGVTVQKPDTGSKGPKRHLLPFLSRRTYRRKHERQHPGAPPTF